MRGTKYFTHAVPDKSRKHKPAGSHFEKVARKLRGGMCNSLLPPSSPPELPSAGASEDTLTPSLGVLYRKAKPNMSPVKYYCCYHEYHYESLSVKDEIPLVPVVLGQHDGMFYKRGSSPQQWRNSKETTTIVRVNDSETKLASVGGRLLLSCFVFTFIC